MLHEDPGNISYSAVGGLSDQIRELRESIELPLMNPELFLRVGIKPPKVIFLSFLLGNMWIYCLCAVFVSFKLAHHSAWNTFRLIGILLFPPQGCSFVWASWYGQNTVS